MPLFLQPELVYAGGTFRRGLVIGVEGGLIRSLEPATAPDQGEVVRLPRRAVVPGFVSAHSHAFQRLLRGATQWRASNRDDFWAWRQRMYHAAERLSPEALEEVCALTFLEMLRAGVTTVGEFHYLHRDPAGQPYRDPNELAKRVIAAAERVGIRIVLLDCIYRRAGAGRDLEGPQRRFDSGPIERFAESLADLETQLKNRPLASVGIAPHSVRAIDPAQLGEIAAACARRSWPVHMHLSEQLREVDGCLAETGRRPVELVAEAGLLGSRFCAVHAVHVTVGESDLLGESHSVVCACPTTERDLGDGVVPADRLLAAGARLCLGSDSNAQIDLLEEARSLELNLRLQKEERVLLAEPGEDRGRLAKVLMDSASVKGAEALGLAGTGVEVGGRADLVCLDLDDPSLAGPEEELAPRLVFGGQTRAVADVMVAGRFAIRDRRHPL